MVAFRQFGRWCVASGRPSRPVAGRRLHSRLLRRGLAKITRSPSRVAGSGTYARSRRLGDGRNDALKAIRRIKRSTPISRMADKTSQNAPGLAPYRPKINRRVLRVNIACVGVAAYAGQRGWRAGINSRCNIRWRGSRRAFSGQNIQRVDG
jgi:hypothetical protein